MHRLDTDDLSRRYLAGEPASHIAKSLGIKHDTVKRHLAKAGVAIRGSKEAQALRFGCPVVSDERMVSMFVSGESVKAISGHVGLSRPTVISVLKRHGHEPRNRSDANRLKLSRMTPEGRLEITKAAHAAVRGVPQSVEHRSKTAMTREAKPRRIPSVGESLFAFLMSERHGLPMTREKAVGPYNVDFALTESAVAVEIFGGHWHTCGKHAAGYRKRLDYLLDRGWLPVVIWVTKSLPLLPSAADYVFALHQIRCVSKPARGQEHVIRCDPDTGAVVEVDPTDRPVVPSSQPPDRVRGDDLGPR